MDVGSSSKANGRGRRALKRELIGISLEAAKKVVEEHNSRVNTIAQWDLPETIEDCKILSAFLKRFVLKEK